MVMVMAVVVMVMVLMTMIVVVVVVVGMRVGVAITMVMVTPSMMEHEYTNQVYEKSQQRYDKQSVMLDFRRFKGSLNQDYNIHRLLDRQAD